MHMMPVDYQNIGNHLNQYCIIVNLLDKCQSIKLFVTHLIEYFK